VISEWRSSFLTQIPNFSNSFDFMISGIVSADSSDFGWKSPF
jgi:hypothetical protein